MARCLSIVMQSSRRTGRGDASLARVQQQCSVLATLSAEHWQLWQHCGVWVVRGGRATYRTHLLSPLSRQEGGMMGARWGSVGIGGGGDGGF